MYQLIENPLRNIYIKNICDLHTRSYLYYIMYRVPCEPPKVLLRFSFSQKFSRILHEYKVIYPRLISEKKFFVIFLNKIKMALSLGGESQPYVVVTPTAAERGLSKKIVTFLSSP